MLLYIFYIFFLNLTSGIMAIYKILCTLITLSLKNTSPYIEFHLFSKK